MSRILAPRRQLIVPRRLQAGFILNPFRFGAGSGTDPHWGSVVSLLHFEGADGSTAFTDQVGTTTWTRAAGAEIDTAQSKFGGSSGLFPAAVSSGFGKITSNTSAGFALGTSDFTIDWFHMLNAAKAGFRMILDGRPTGSNGLYPTIYVDGSVIYYYVNGSNRILANSGTINLSGTWQHGAVCRASGTTRMFINGTQVGSNYTDSNNYANQRFRWGNTGTSDSADNIFGGWLDECRITKAARYTGTFTPPSSPFPNS